MEAIGSQVREGLTHQQQKPSGKPSSQRLPETWVRGIFAKFAARYPHKWTSSFPTAEALRVAMDEWGERLGDLKPDEIRKGLDTWHGSWPPSVEEFRQTCKTRAAAMHRITPKALPETAERKQERAALARRAVEEMRGILKSRKKTGARHED